MNSVDDILDAGQALHLLKEMLRIRRFEARCAELYSAGHIRGFLHLYDGEEAIAVGVMQALQAEDAIVSTYREHGHALARGLSMNVVMAELFGKASGCSRGRGGSMHIFDAATRFYGGNAIVAGGLPLAIGLALAYRMRGTTQLVACFFGEGAAAEGEFHESLNLAALWNLPVLFLCENNRYAMGTALDRSEAETDIQRKAASYKLASYAVDGMDLLSVVNAAHAAVADIRNGKGPVFMELRTYRFRAHSMFDAQLYRNKTEVTQWQQHDPIECFKNYGIKASLLSTDAIAKIAADIEQEVTAAVNFAHAAGWEPLEQLTRFVYAETPSP
jgi:pyruvate dehydrogenase E1 component alpha subunit